MKKLLNSFISAKWPVTHWVLFTDLKGEGGERGRGAFLARWDRPQRVLCVSDMMSYPQNIHNNTKIKKKEHGDCIVLRIHDFSVFQVTALRDSPSHRLGIRRNAKVGKAI